MDQAFFKDKKVVIMGLGRFGGGVDSALFAARAGADVLVTDLASETELTDSLDALKGLSVRFSLGGHRIEDFRDADILIVNPAVRPDNKYVQIARKNGALVTSQIEIFFQLCDVPIIGITGANGKSTTTSLTAHLLAAGERRIWLSGNIGHQPLLDIVDRIEEDDLVVLEISNFQLEQLARIQMAPRISLITNLTPNHLDRHGTFEVYCRVKEGIFKYQKCGSETPAVSIFNSEDSIAGAWYKKYLDEKGRTCLAFSADDVPNEYTHVYQLPGRANRSNLAAALAIVSCFEIAPSKIAEALTTFKGLPQRLQCVADINGVRWYDDSKATTPVSTMSALNGIDEPKILIAGGYDKKISFTELGRCIAERAKACVLIGQTAGSIAEAVQQSGNSSVVIERADSMQQAVQITHRLSGPGDVVLMSPACASYDMFKNYIQRSQVYISAVNMLPK